MQDLTEEIKSLQEENKKCGFQIKSLENELVEYRRMEAALSLPPDKLKVRFLSLRIGQSSSSCARSSLQNRLRLAEKSITDLTTKLMMWREGKTEEMLQLKSEKENVEMRLSEHKQTIHRLQQKLHQTPPELATAQKQVQSTRESYVPRLSILVV